MKLLLLLTLLSFSCAAQSRVGYNYAQVLSEWKGYDEHTGKSEQGIPYIDVKMDDMLVCYMFNEGECYITLIMPTSLARVNGFVEYYNANYVIVDNTHWKAYMNHGVLNIELLYEDTTGAPYFAWTR